MINRKYLFSIILLTVIIAACLFCSIPAVKATSTLVLNPIADSYISREESDVNYGSASYLKVWAWSDTLQYCTYIKFDLTSIPSDASISSAKLELYLSYRTGDATSPTSVYYCSDNTWTELGITWNNAPSFEQTAAYTNSTIAFEETWYSWIITESVSKARPNQEISLVLVSTSKTIDSFVSKDPEHWAEYKPRLVVTYNLLDDKPPKIINVVQEPQPDKVEPFQNVKITANVTDYTTGVSNVILSYTINNGSIWTNITMIYNSSTQLYETAIHGQPLDTFLKYNIIAYDYAGNCIVEDKSGQYYSYQVVLEFPTAIPLLLLLIMLATIVIFTKRRPKTQI